ncbi:DUF6461 domain-containing protein [Streptosporangium subroseum]|uniref:DUF6461 domain-containing protein n=1 Tax=Streptosporangium subroseum TaxID=106412 RepID=UPI003422751B
MTERPEEFRWLSDNELLGEIYCVSFVRGLSPEEVLRRFGVDESTLEEVAFDELEERSVESMRDDAAGYIGAAKIGDWIVVIEPGGWQIAGDTESRPSVIGRFCCSGSPDRRSRRAVQHVADICRRYVGGQEVLAPVPSLATSRGIEVVSPHARRLARRAAVPARGRPRRTRRPTAAAAHAGHPP